jgi:hypothetical protein
VSRFELLKLSSGVAQGASQPKYALDKDEQVFEIDNTKGRWRCTWPGCAAERAVRNRNGDPYSTKPDIAEMRLHAMTATHRNELALREELHKTESAGGNTVHSAARSAGALEQVAPIIIKGVTIAVAGQHKLPFAAVPVVLDWCVSPHVTLHILRSLRLRSLLLATFADNMYGAAL